jgi:acyl-CoA synthetase (AMP-forming)/AMP-acid ligase II
MTMSNMPAAHTRDRRADGPAIPDMTLPDFVLARAQLRGARRALVEADSGRELTYAQLATAVREAGAWLAARGVRPGDVLALCAPNSIEFAVTAYAALSAGAILTMVNPIATGEEIVHHLRQTGACWLVTTADLFVPKLEAAALASGIADTFLIGADAEAAPGARRFDVLHSGGVAEGLKVDRSPSDVAFLASSSGTSGPPKSVVLTHRNLVAGLSQLLLVYGETEDDVVIAALPLSHIFGFQASLNLALLEGATVVLLPRFELGAFLRAVQDYAVTRAGVAPPIVLALANSELVDDYDLSSLRVLTSAAAPLGAGLAHACAQRIGCRVKQAYGLTEAGGGVCVPPDDGQDRPDSVGPVVPGVECRVVDPDTQADLGPGEPGELLVRSASASRGYLGDPEATAATIDGDGWVHTGDIVTVDTRTLASAGASVGLLARTGGELAETAAEIELAGGIVAAAIADVTDQPVLAAAVAELHDRLGPADVLINNAGIGGPLGPMWEADPADWWRTLEINLGGAFVLTRTVLPGMIAAGHGRILNITSNAGVYRWPLASAYATSKAALVKLTENLAAETRRHGVSVLSVDPGLLPIGLTQPKRNSEPAPGTPEGRIAAWTRDRIASGHGADPDQAARLILRLARGCGDHLSGRHLTVTDDLDALLGRIDEIQREDLHTLRLRQ